MPTYVKTDYVPERMKDCITAGKEYRVRSINEFGWYIKDDLNECLCLYYKGCAHLDNRTWTVINRP